MYINPNALVVSLPSGFRFHLIFSLVLLNLVAATPALGQVVLWQNTSSGMSVEQVRVAQPNAQPTADRTPLETGAICELQIAGYEVLSHRFDVCFLFRDGHLEHVNLRSQRVSAAAYDGIVRLLTGRYGTPLSVRPAMCRMQPPMTMCFTEWMVEGGLNVTIALVDAYGQQALTIVYGTGLRDAVDRL